ncbi:MAG: ATP-grasp domain-containing protein [Mycobacterium sp.]|uniref:ATP-grasp domain-containing protein n=1 Tax=Mycobacterium sp. TaxID=1785 RepID=UPI001EC67D36|nr:ATP-grasp domain-containing protein [Mycobacterium sp.]MBW0017782.1 ATP-grasp domain-containing protein [Mycobacterium sp.]
MTLRVGITGVSGDVGRGAVRGLRRNPPGAEPIWILGLDSSTHRHPDVDECMQLPLVREPGYADAVQAAVIHHGVEVLLPCIDSEIVVLSAARGLFAGAAARVVLAPCPLIKAAADKLATAHFLAARGISTPATFDTAAAVDALGLPIVAKPRSGHGSRGVKVLRDRVGLQEFLAEPPPNYCLQRYIAGPEFTVGFLYDAHGVMQDAVAMERTLDDGRTVRASVVDNPDMRRFIAAFGERVPGLGAVNAQLRWDDNDGPLVFEINARLSGSTEMRVAVGCNDPLRLVRHFGRGDSIARAQPQMATVHRRGSELRVDPC